MNAQIVMSIYELALKERLRCKSNETFTKRYAADLEFVLLPTTLQSVVPERAVYFEKDNSVPVKGKNWIVYPESTEALKEARELENIPLEIAGGAGLVGEATDFELFDIKNFSNTHYHQIKSHLLIRGCYHEFMVGNVDMQAGVYRVKHSGKKLTEQEFMAEVEKFNQAVILKAAEIMYQKYKISVTSRNKLVLDFCRNYAEEIRQYLLTQSVMNDELFSKITVRDFEFGEFDCAISGNLEWDVMRFLSKAYNLVYHEI